MNGSTVPRRNADGSGGTIVADGKSVDIGGTATLSAAATAPGAAGGAVLVGVTAPGGVNEAQSTTVASGATISAVGNAGGAGGKIETSGQVLSLGAASVDAGSGGSWVLDPEDLTIGSAAATAIETALIDDTNVTEETTGTVVTDGSGTTASGNGDIDVDAAITWSGSATLTLSAFNNVNIGATIDATSGGTLDIVTGNDVGGASASGTTLNFTGGNIEFTGTNGEQPERSLSINGHTYTLIQSVSALDGIGSSPYYALAEPLNASGYTGFAPIGESGSSFTGTFNGLGNTISNLTISSGDADVGLFGQVGYDGVVENIGLIGGSVTGTAACSNVGALAGENGYDASMSNDYATGTVSGDGAVGGLVGFNDGGSIADARATGAVSGSGFIGGLVGDNDFNGSISNAYATGSVTGTGAGSDVGGLVGKNDQSIASAYATGAVSGSGFIGGLVGENYYDGSIIDAYATGTVTATGTGNDIGGLVGKNDQSIASAYATGAVSGSGFIGGLVGENYYDGSIIDAYATGAVTATGTGNDIGGLVGENDQSISDASATGAVSGSGLIGGLVGQNDYDGSIIDAYATGAVTGTGTGNDIGGLVGENDQSISDAYATGAVSGGTDTGGLVGDNDGGTYTDDYFDTTTSGTTTGVGSESVSGVTGLTTAQLEAALPTGFDGGVWGDAGGQTTPYLLGLAGNQVLVVGDGSTPYTVILTAQQLQTVNDNLTGDYVLGNSIDASGFTNFSPLGESTAFTGDFNGLGYTIANLTIDDASDPYVGLFGQIGADGTVGNIGLTGENVTGSADGAEVGGLAGYNDGQIANVYAAGAVTGSAEFVANVGGLVGQNGFEGTIEDAYATGAVTATGAGTDGESSDGGGLVGGNRWHDRERVCDRDGYWW